MSSELLKVHVKSPSLQETISFETERDADLQQLKLLIQANFPGDTSPKPEDQRIIYNGKVLDDDALRSALKETSATMLTFHVVVNKPALHIPHPTPSSGPYHPPPHTTSTSPSRSSNSWNPESTTTQQSSSPLMPPPLPGGYQLVAINGQYYLAPVLVPVYGTLPALSAENSRPAASSRQRHPSPNPNVGTADVPPPARPAPVPAPAQDAMARQQAAARAASVWLALKLVFILFIVCQGASIERMLFFHVIAFVFFLYQTGRLRFVVRVRRGQLGEINLNAPHHGAATPAHPDASTSEPRQDGASNQDQQQPATVLDMVKRGAYTFIASLWPNYGRDPRIAQAFENGQQDPIDGF